MTCDKMLPFRSKELEPGVMGSLGNKFREPILFIVTGNMKAHIMVIT